MSHLSVTQVFPWSFREATDNPCVHGTFRGTSATAVSASAKVLQWVTLAHLVLGGFDHCSVVKESYNATMEVSTQFIQVIKLIQFLESILSVRHSR